MRKLYLKFICGTKRVDHQHQLNNSYQQNQRIITLKSSIDIPRPYKPCWNLGRLSETIWPRRRKNNTAKKVQNQGHVYSFLYLLEFFLWLSEHYEFFHTGETVSIQYDLGAMRRLCDAVRQKIWSDNFWFLQQDNAPPHTALYFVIISPETRPISFRNHRICLT